MSMGDTMGTVRTEYYDREVVIAEIEEIIAEFRVKLSMKLYDLAQRIHLDGVDELMQVCEAGI